MNVRQVFVAEPFFGAGVQKLVFTMQLAPSSTASAPPSSQWYLIWNRLNPDADFDRYYVAMKSDASGNVSYEYGKFGVPLAAGPNANPNANTPVRLGDADSGTYDPVNGVITITLSNSKAENIGAGQMLAKLNARTYLARPEGGPRAQNNANDITADFDHTLYGNAFCNVIAAAIAAFADATTGPRTGLAPLTVTFDATASSDPDGDSISSYVFNFGDGSAPVEQTSPTVQHVYRDSGNYQATVRVKDSRNALSDNAAQAVIQVDSTLSGVASRKSHGNGGLVFDIPLPNSGAVGVECRNNGSNSHTVVFTFQRDLTGVTSSTVAEGNATKSGEGVGPNPNQYSVTLTGVANAQFVTVRLDGVQDTAGANLTDVRGRMAVLNGDTTGNLIVNSSDIGQTKAVSGAPLGTGNFRLDVNANGDLNATDISQIKANSGNSLQ